MSAAESLGTVVEALVEQIVERKLAERIARGDLAAPAPAMRRTVRVPEAENLTGVPADSIRQWIAAGLIPRRLAGRKLDPARPTYLVTVEEVLAAAEKRGKPTAQPPAPEKPIDLESRARALRARYGRKET